MQVRLPFLLIIIVLFGLIILSCSGLLNTYLIPSSGMISYPPPTHTLNIGSFPVTGVTFTLDGISHATLFSTTIDEGSHTVVMPSTVIVGETTYNFVRWEDGSTSPTRTFTIAADMTITAYYEVVSPPELLTPRWLVAAPRASGEVTLSWRLDSDPNRVGYNVYRGTTSGRGYIKVNSAPITTTSYVDTGLSNSQTYYYVVKAVDVHGVESLTSNEAKATATSSSSMFGVCLTINVDEELDLRIGDLTGDGYIDYLFSKWDDYKKAFNHKGELLWQINMGSHGPLHYGWSGEYTPTTIWDVDNDGLNEVVCQYWEGEVWYVAVLEGATGKVKAKVQIPERCYKLAIANFRGLPKAQDVVINLGEDEGGRGAIAFGWVGNGLTQLWRYYNPVKAHYPKPADVDGDGRDEYVTGNAVLSGASGSVLYNLPLSSGHADSIMISDFGLGGRKLILISEEWAGRLYMFDPATTRKVLWEIYPERSPRAFHEIDIGNVRDDYPGYEIEVTEDEDSTPSYVYLIANDGKVIWRTDTITNTEEAKLIQWTGGDLLEIRTVAAQPKGGIYDGRLNKISNFVGDRIGDAIGDYREEILTFRGGVFYVVTNPDFNTNSKPSIWESNQERVMEEYVNYSFY